MSAYSDIHISRDEARSMILLAIPGMTDEQLTEVCQLIAEQRRSLDRPNVCAYPFRNDDWQQEAFDRLMWAMRG